MKDRAIRFTIRPAKGAQDTETVKVLIREYLAFLGADLSFQNVEAELSGLPGKYAAPEGALFLVWAREASGRETAAGCAALRKLGRGDCEMKRLFVRPEYRGAGLGRTLADDVVREARRLGYKRMRLDTLERLADAVRLYRSIGFQPIPPYCENPLPGAMFWELGL